MVSAGGAGVTTALYPSGYSNQLVHLDDLVRRHGPFQPEYERRLRAALVAAGGLVGIGGGWRSSEAQRRVFLERHAPVVSGGCCVYNGQRYALKAGMAHAAPPESSFHETQQFADGTSGCSAVDLVGRDGKHTQANDWMRTNGAAFGLMTAWNWSVKEPWHCQMSDLPRSVSAWKADGRPAPQRWPLPGGAPPAPIPPEDDMKMATARFDGYADQFLLVPLTADSHRRIGADGQAPIVIRTDLNRSQLEAEVGYELKPLGG